MLILCLSISSRMWPQSVGSLTYCDFISLMFVATSMELGMVCDVLGLGQSLHT